MRKKDPNKEKQIRARALEMIVRDGYDSFGMQKLARAACVSPATLYIYFKDKEDLILDLYNDVSEKMAQETLMNFDPEMPFSEGLRVQWVNRSRYCLENMDHVIFLEQIRHSSLQEKAMNLLSEKFRAAMGRFVHNAIDRGELVKVPLEVYWSIAYAPLYNLLRFHQTGKSYGGHTFTFSEDMMNRTLEIVLKGLKP